MVTHIEWVEAAASSVAYEPASIFDSDLNDGRAPVLAVGVPGDTVMAVTGSRAEITALLHDALAVVHAYWEPADDDEKQAN